MGKKPTKLQRKKKLERQLKRKKDIRRTQGILDNLTGYMTEMRFLNAFLDTDIAADTFPPWFRGVKKSSLAQYRSGIDFIIETDCGDFNLQIKSSERAALGFSNRPSRKHIPVIAAVKSDTPEFIRYQTFKIVEQSRAARLEKKREKNRRRRLRKSEKRNAVNNLVEHCE